MTTAPTIDVGNGRFFDDPWESYRWLRDNDPVHWDEKNKLWLISRHADVSLISRDPQRYCSRFGVRPAPNNVPLSLITSDDPEHNRVRKLINRGFTPRQVKALAPHIRQITNEVIDEIQARGEIEFVEDFAIHVPLIVIAELMGLDPAARKNLYRWSDAMMAGNDSLGPDDPVMQRAGEAFGEYVMHLVPIVEERRAHPREDLISILTSAYDDGALDPGELAYRAQVKEAKAAAADEETVADLSDDELLMFLCVLVVAGNETTRNAISGGMRAFSEFPSEKEKLLANPDLIALASDEVVRYVTPVISFTRTVTEDHELHGKQLREGDTVLMLYQSANRDERVFDDPDTFRIDRNPNPHLGFGIGPHFCLGANLARLEVQIVFEELFRRLRDIRVPDGTPYRRGSNTLVIAIENLPAVFTPVLPDLG